MKIANVWAAAVLGVCSLSLAQEQPAKPETPPAAPPATPAAPETRPSEPETQPKADQPKEDLPDAASLFDKHLAAVGGVDALKAEKNRLLRAKYAVPSKSAEGMMRILRIAPDKVSILLEIPGLSTQETWCNSEGAWIKDSNTGARRALPEEAAEMKLQADYLGEANYKKRYREIVTSVREKVNDADVFTVQAVPHEGKPRQFCFDANTGLLAAIRMPAPGAPQQWVTTAYSDYKKFGEILHPTKWVTTFDGREVTIVTITQVETNLAMMPSVDPPDEVKALK